MGKTSSVIFKASDYYSPKFWPTWFVLGLLRLISLLPYRAGLFTGRLIGRLISLLSGRRKRIVDINLAHCFPEKPAMKETVSRLNVIRISVFHW